MTLQQLLYVFLITLLLTGCRRGYVVENDKVYYEYWNEGTGQNKQVVPEADANSFQEFSLDCKGSFEFGKDKDHLFINGKLIENIDPHTFSFIGNYIFRDKDSAYFFGTYTNSHECVIKGVDPIE